MAALKDLSIFWRNIKEIDLKPIRDSATYPLRIAIVGAQGSGRHTLAEQLRTDPTRPGIHTQSPITLITPEAAAEPPNAHLIVVLVDASRPDFSDEQLLVKKWSEGGKNVLVFVNKIDLTNNLIMGDSGWLANKVIHGSANDSEFLQREFIPVVLEMLPQLHLALGRQFPLFRLTIARQVINETCFSNAAYSFSTGLAEIIPVLDLPLNITDWVVLTKSQAFLAYRLGLLLGFSTRWQDYVTEFGSVIGSGFVWRQVARSLVGLIPGWGIIPEVAIAYSGTYVVGNAILGWYLTGRKLSAKQMRTLSIKAFTRGKDYALKLGQKLPKPLKILHRRERLPAPLKKAALPAEIVINKPGIEPAESVKNPLSAGASRVEVGSDIVLPVKKDHAFRSRPDKRTLVGRRKQKEPIQAILTRTCPQCGKESSADALFCQYCGITFEK